MEVRIELRKRKERNNVQRNERSGNGLAMQVKGVETFRVQGSAA